MDKGIKREVARLRALGWPMKDALRTAKIRVRFEAAEAEGLVELALVPDDEAYDASYVDTWTDLSPGRRERVKREILERADSKGVYGLVARAKLACGELHDVDSCWGFVGDDVRDHGYDVDLMASALDAIGT